ncbi:MAG: acyl--CoA ligase [Ruminococcaceae bacterium]|nr:acyl--CoA ligase [Oscillospiraceae bacterium]
MCMITKPQYTMKDILPHYADMNCYEYFLACTQHIKDDYPILQFMGTDHQRSEILADIDSLAYYFKEELHFQVGDVFTLFTPNTVEEVVILFALNKIGCITSLLHPMFPSDAMRAALEFTKSKGVLLPDFSFAKHAKTLGAMGVQVIVSTPALYAVKAEDKLTVRPNADHIAAADDACNFTFYGDILRDCQGKTTEGISRSGDLVGFYMNGGGTTGQSKTIMLSSTNINAAINNKFSLMIPSDDVPGSKSNIAALPFFHCFGLCCTLLCAIFAGNKCILMMSFNADDYIDILKKNPCYDLVGVPNMYRKLLDHPNFPGEHLQHIKYAYIGGDNVPIEFMNRFNTFMEAHGSTAILMPGYGLTECSACDCSNILWNTKPGTVGTDFETARIVILDEDKKEVPYGTVGEVAITGDCVMKGYLTDDGRHGEGIYTDENGTQWVLTGDLAKMDEDRFLTFIARRKRLIIISGYNVFPADIENLLEPLPFIHENCAVQGYNEQGKPIVRLYITLAPGAQLEKLDEYKQTITTLCAEKLSRFSVPREICVLDKMPRTRMDKIDFISLTQTLN